MAGSDLPPRDMVRNGVAREQVAGSSSSALAETHDPELYAHYFSEIRPHIQVTLNCNLGCSYCFQSHVGPVMRLETVEAIIQQLSETYYSQSRITGTKPLEIIWHGGEPLIAGYKFFEGILKIQSEYPNIPFLNHLQTNATLMTEDLASLFVDGNFQLGFSLDGPEDLHDSHRYQRRGKLGSFQDTMRGIELYQRKAQLDHIPIISVITADSIARCEDIYQFYHRIGAMVGLDMFDIVATDLGGSDGTHDWQKRLAPSSEDIGDFLIELFDYWFYDKSQRVDIREFRDEVKIVYEKEKPLGDPFHKKRCHTTRTVIAPNGNVYSCDQYINDEKSSLGNLHSDSLTEIIVRKARLWEQIKRGIRGKRKRSSFACTSCDWAEQCAGGCVTCMKYNSLLLTAREQGLQDSQWVELLDDPTPLDSLYGEFYYCSGLIRFREHINQAIAKEFDRAVV